MSRKKIFVTKSSMPSFDEYTEEIKDIFESCYLTNMGPKHEKFRTELKKYLGVSDIELFTNGHMALELALAAMKLKGEVITTPFTFVSTTHAIVRNGLTPVFCDVNPVDYTMDVNRIEELITDKTCAIMPVHVYGNVCNVEAINEIADKHGLKVIYDAAHTFGCTYKGKAVGAYGDAACYSFHATKVFHSIEGGAMVCQDPVINRRVAGLRNFGIRDEVSIPLVGANAKMNEFCAAMGICNLRHLDEAILKRKAAALHYMERLDGIAGIKLNTVQKDVESNYAYFPVIIDEKVTGFNRDQLSLMLNQHDIYPRKYFYPLINHIEAYQGVLDPGDTPVADRLGTSVLTLPLFEEITMEDIDLITELIRDFAGTNEA